MNIQDLINNNILDNNQGLITPEKLREVLNALSIGSLEKFEFLEPATNEDIGKHFSINAAGKAVLSNAVEYDPANHPGETMNILFSIGVLRKLDEADNNFGYFQTNGIAEVELGGSLNTIVDFKQTLLGHNPPQLLLVGDENGKVRVFDLDNEGGFAMSAGIAMSNTTPGNLVKIKLISIPLGG